MVSPSEFLTFYRRAGMTAAARSGPRVLLPAKRSAPRWIATSAVRGKELSTDGSTKTDLYPDDKHAVNKVKDGDKYDVQSANVKGGMDARKSGTGGHATEGQDSAGGKEKAKKEFPEAPDPAIGMQDERGGRGG